MDVPPEAFPQNKSQLLLRIREDRERLQRVLESLSVEQAAELDLGNGWTVKDHLAHIAAWEGRLLATLNDAPPWQGLGIDRLSYESGRMDDWNELIYARERHRNIEDVMADFQTRHAEVFIALLALSEADLRRRYDPDNPRSGPLLGHIAANTFEHYAEHAEWIGAALQGHL
jgi:hypothetical protein